VQTMIIGSGRCGTAPTLRLQLAAQVMRADAGLLVPTLLVFCNFANIRRAAIQ
jgi:hypothetical protein